MFMRDFHLRTMGKQRQNTEESRNTDANASTRRNFTVVDTPQLSRIPPFTFNRDCTVRLFLLLHRCGSKARSPQTDRSTYVTTATRRVTVSFFRLATRESTRNRRCVERKLLQISLCLYESGYTDCVSRKLRLEQDRLITPVGKYSTSM